MSVTPLEEVKRLNYDHHRRMTELHYQQLSTGENQQVSRLDDISLRELLKPVPQDRKAILELGSSSGGQWHVLKEWAPEGKLSGIDLYEPAVQHARLKGLDISVGFVEEMSMFKEHRFDLVCSRHVMEHLGDVWRGIEEIRRVLKPGGFSAHVTPDMEVDAEPSHLNKFKLKEWEQIWQWHGFKIISAIRHNYHGGEVHIVATR